MPSPEAEDAPHLRIVRLLRSLYKLNSQVCERGEWNRSTHDVLPDSAFVNNKLTAKLTRQLEEPMIVARYVLQSDENTSF